MSTATKPITWDTSFDTANGIMTHTFNDDKTTMVTDFRNHTIAVYVDHEERNKFRFPDDYKLSDYAIYLNNTIQSINHK